MEKGLDPPCLELGDDPEHGLLTWLSVKAKDGVVPFRPDKVSFRVGREVGVFRQAPFTTLVDDGWIEKEHHGESFRWKVLVACFCGRDFRPPPLAALASGVSISAERVGNGASGHGSGDSGYEALVGVKSRSIQKPVRPCTALARDVFPQLLRDAGIVNLDNDTPGLASHLTRWKREDGVSINDIRSMMTEFVRHPEWCQRARVAPWQVFVRKRQELINLTISRRRRDPSLYWQESENPVTFRVQRDPSFYWT
jgi:hypothetical protein